MKKREMIGVLLSLFLAGCNSSYVRNLEEIVMQNQGTINVLKEEKSRAKIPFKYLQRYLVVDNEAINLLIYNSDKPYANIILLPTLGEPASSLSRFSEEMASRGYNVYAFDIEGFGRSSGERGKISIQRIQKNISAAIDYVKSRNSGKIVLAGTSMGSELSLLYSTEGKYKDEISAVVAQGYFVPSSSVPDFDVRVSFCRNPLNKPLVEFLSGGKLNIIDMLGFESFYNNKEEMKQVLEDKDYVIKIHTGPYIDFLNHKPKNTMTSFKKPCLFIFSKHDKMIPFSHSINVYSYFRKENKNAVLYIPRGLERNGKVPHMAFDTNSCEITRQIDSFLRGNL